MVRCSAVGDIHGFLAARSLRLRRKRQVLPFLEGLEIRINPAVFNVVAATADGATGSLRDAIDQSDTNGDASNTINLAAGTYSLTDTAVGDLLINDHGGGGRGEVADDFGRGGRHDDRGRRASLNNRVFQIVSSQGAAVTLCSRT